MALASPAKDCHWLSCANPRCREPKRNTVPQIHQAQMAIRSLWLKAVKGLATSPKTLVFKAFFNFYNLHFFM